MRVSTTRERDQASGADAGEALEEGQLRCDCLTQARGVIIMSEVQHIHKVKHRARTQAGTVYEVCECGAVQIIPAEGGEFVHWHACELCSHEMKGGFSHGRKAGTKGS